MARASRKPRRAGRLAALAVAVLAAVSTSACGEAERGGGSGSPSRGEGGFPVTVGAVTLEHRPNRIVVLSPTATEMLFAIGAGGQVVAVDDQSNYPKNAPKTDLSGFKPSAEAIAAKSPDLVVLSSDTNKIVDQLAALRIPTFTVPAARTLDDTYSQLAELGRLTGNTEAAAQTVNGVKDEIKRLTRDLAPRTEKLTYYHELDPTLYSVTSETFIGSIYTLFGLVNIADKAGAASGGSGYPRLSAETVVKANPDLIFLADVKCCQMSTGALRARAGWSDLAAVKNDRVVTLDDDVASRWGPRVTELARAVRQAVEKVPTA